MSSLQSPRRSARVAAAAVPSPSPAPSSAPTPSPAPGAPKKDTRPRCCFYLEAKKRICYRISCDGVVSFCTEHVPARPYAEEYEVAENTFLHYLATHPLSDPVKYDWNNREQFAGMTKEQILALMAPHKEVFERIQAVLKPFREFHQRCIDLHINDRSIQLYTEMNRSAYAHWSTYDLLEDYLDDIFKHGYIAGNRGYEYFCAECCTTYPYTSEAEPERERCPACV